MISSGVPGMSSKTGEFFAVSASGTGCPGLRTIIPPATTFFLEEVVGYM